MTTVHTLTFAELLRRHRRAVGLTQEELAEHTGLGVRSIGDLERGVSNRPHKDTVVLLASALRLAPEERVAFEAAARRRDISQPLLANASPAPLPRPRHHNLPTPPTPLIGREHEEAAITHLLYRDEVRLLTLTGPPGIGKTRLALQVAAGLTHHSVDGVVFVSLAPIGEPDLVLSAIAQALEMHDGGVQSLRDTVATHLSDKHLLLVLDNFEQVLPAAVLVADLLATTEGLKVLVTSRAVLHLRGEQEMEVPPLELPDAAEQVPVEELGHYAAVGLFVQRARAVKPTFALTHALAPVVTAICRRLDGIPLAIELAAARVKLLPPHTLLAQLEGHRLSVLTGGARDLPERQRTLRDALTWSYDLLHAGEQDLFRRLSVFVGGWTLEAAEAICAVDSQSQNDVLEGLASLVDKSLVRQRETPEGQAHFGMLETVREYAWEQLEASSEAETVRRRHAEYFVALAEEADLALRGAEQGGWLQRLERDHDNLHAALRWARERGEFELGLRLASGLWLFWQGHGHLAEGSTWLDDLLAHTAPDGLAGGSDVPKEVRARALNAAGNLALDQGDYLRSAVLNEECLALRRELGDTWGVAASLNNLANAVVYPGEYRRAAALYEESLAAFRALRDRWCIATTLHNLAFVAIELGEYSRAEALLEEALAIRRDVGDVGGIASSLQSLGSIGLHLGDYSRAAGPLEESLTLFRELQIKGGVAFTLQNLADVALHQGNLADAVSLLEEGLRLGSEVEETRLVMIIQCMLGQIAREQGDVTRAAALYRESLASARSMGDGPCARDALEGLAGVALATGQLKRAARLYAVSAAMRETMGTPVPPYDRVAYDRTLADLRAALGEEVFVPIWDEGRTTPLEQILVELDEHM